MSGCKQSRNTYRRATGCRGSIHIKGTRHLYRFPEVERPGAALGQAITASKSQTDHFNS